MELRFASRQWLCAVILTAGSDMLLAQPTTASVPQRSMVTVYHLKPDMANEWMDLQKNEVVPALKKAGVKRRAMWQTVIGDRYEYVSVTPLDSFAEVETTSYQRGLEPVAAARLREKLRKCLTGLRTFVSNSIPELSIAGDPSKPVPFIRLATIRVAPGKLEEYRDLIRTQLVPAYRKAKVASWSVSSRGYGAYPGEVTLALGFNTLAELDALSRQGAVFERAGISQEEATRFRARRAGLTTTVEMVIRRRVLDLSF